MGRIASSVGSHRSKCVCSGIGNCCDACRGWVGSQTQSVSPLITSLDVSAGLRREAGVTRSPAELSSLVASRGFSYCIFENIHGVIHSSDIPQRGSRVALTRGPRRVACGARASPRASPLAPCIHGAFASASAACPGRRAHPRASTRFHISAHARVSPARLLRRCPSPAISSFTLFRSSRSFGKPSAIPSRKPQT